MIAVLKYVGCHHHHFSSRWPKNGIYQSLGWTQRRQLHNFCIRNRRIQNSPESNVHVNVDAVDEIAQKGEEGQNKTKAIVAMAAGRNGNEGVSFSGVVLGDCCCEEESCSSVAVLLSG